MYFPYLRGKQFELLAVRETARTLSDASFVPIIEPVKSSFASLSRALDAIVDAGGRAAVVANPRYGALSADSAEVMEFLGARYAGGESIRPALLLGAAATDDEIRGALVDLLPSSPVLIHDGYANADLILNVLGDELELTTNVFNYGKTSTLYRRHFAGAERVLLRDGFEQRRNADYDPVDYFSDLHITYEEQNVDGFGDFLIVGDNFSEGGGPAYAVAIHLTFVDYERDGAMYVYHFVSDTNDTPTDPAGKFRQALEKLMATLDSGNSKLFESTGITEFRRLYADAHFPGLGVVKKLSMVHHIETLAAFASDAA